MRYWQLGKFRNQNVFYIFLILIAYLQYGCSKQPGADNIPAENSKGYYTDGSKLMKDGKSMEFRGTNKMSLWDWNYDQVSSWGMDITRECIDMKMTSDDDLERLVTLARNKGFVIILTAFWYDSDAFPGGSSPYPDCQLLGSTPSMDQRYPQIINKWKHIARLFSNQSDVWFGIWNEPYGWDKANTASSDQWLLDASSLIDTIRETGANNILVVCGNAMGQGHEPFLEKGAQLLNGRKNIVFDIHAYNTYWNIPVAAIENRINELKNINVAPIIIGEFANNGEEVYPAVLDACRSTHTSVLAWLWGQYQEPFNSTFKVYCGEKRN